MAEVNLTGLEPKERKRKGNKSDKVWIGTTFTNANGAKTKDVFEAAYRVLVGDMPYSEYIGRLIITDLKARKAAKQGK